MIKILPTVLRSDKDIHFILELIQNAEDNKYQIDSAELKFVLIDDDPTAIPNSDGCLCIFNNEVGVLNGEKKKNTL